MKKLFEFISNIPMLLAALPTLLSIVNQAKERFGSKQMQAFIRALRDLVASFIDSDNATPPTPGVGGGSMPVNPIRREQRQQNRKQRLNDFRNRTRLFTKLPNSEVQELCQKHHIPYEEIT